MIDGFKSNNIKISEFSNQTEKKASRVITITSGKGGVGKTSFTINLGIALRKLGHRVIIIDADLGLGNVDIALGLIPKYTLANVVRNEVDILDILIEYQYGLKIIAGGSGIKDLINLPKDKLNSILDSLYLLNDMTDYLLIDTGAGLNNSVISFTKAADEVIFIVTPEPTSITDTYAVIKNISTEEKNIKIIVNRIESSDEGYEIFNKINAATKKFLNVELENLGFIYEDQIVKKSIMEQSPFMIAYPNSIASQAINLIAYNLVNNTSNINKVSNFYRFIKNLFRNV